MGAVKKKQRKKRMLAGDAQFGTRRCTMGCKYFISDILGSCGATGCSHIPRISEMEQLCFKSFHACSIYNEYEGSHVPVVVKDQSNAEQLSPTMQMR